MNFFESWFGSKEVRDSKRKAEINSGQDLTTDLARARQTLRGPSEPRESARELASEEPNPEEALLLKEKDALGKDYSGESQIVMPGALSDEDDLPTPEELAAEVAAKAAKSPKKIAIDTAVAPAVAVKEDPTKISGRRAFIYEKYGNTYDFAEHRSGRVAKRGQEKTPKSKTEPYRPKRKPTGSDRVEV